MKSLVDNNHSLVDLDISHMSCWFLRKITCNRIAVLPNAFVDLPPPPPISIYTKTGLLTTSCWITWLSYVSTHCITMYGSVLRSWVRYLRETFPGSNCIPCHAAWFLYLCFLGGRQGHHTRAQRLLTLKQHGRGIQQSFGSKHCV